MSLCRPSHQLIRRAKSSIVSSKKCRACAIPLVLRPFHSTSRQFDDIEKPPKEPENIGKALDKPRSKAPALRKRAEIAAERKRTANAGLMKSVKAHFRPYSGEELNALALYYTPEQMEALHAAEKAVDLEDLADQWGPRVDQWKVDYLDDLSRVDPLVDKKVQLNLSDAPRMMMRDEFEFDQEPEEEEDDELPTFDADIDENFQFRGLSLIEMLYLIERRKFLSDKIKAGLRTLHKYKDTHREYPAKKILWHFLPKSSTEDRETLESIVTDDATGKTSVAFLFDVLDSMDSSFIDPVKKYELLAMKHWAGTPKEEALRDQLLRTIAQHGGHAPQVIEQALNLRLKNLHAKELGFNIDDDYWLVDGPQPELYDRDIFYNAVSPDIPKIKDPRVDYSDSDNEDIRGARLKELAGRLGVTEHYLRGMRTKRLVVHRVVNQTALGKIQRIYTLTIAGNENGLLGIGEGKSAEAEDSGLQSMLNALRNMKPVPRYERRTIYGKLKGKSGGTTVELDARPPGFGIRTQSLIFEIARCAGIRDLSARVGRSRNKMNAVKATVAALMNQTLPEDIARARGRKMVDVRKVYYGRTVY